jgi:hypothetical protein
MSIIITKKHSLHATMAKVLVLAEAMVEGAVEAQGAVDDSTKSANEARALAIRTIAGAVISKGPHGAVEVSLHKADMAIWRDALTEAKNLKQAAIAARKAREWSQLAALGVRAHLKPQQHKLRA